jgi:hypothetical protein
MNRSRTSTRIVSGILGAVILAIGIFLQSEFPNQPVIVQVTVWTLLLFAIMVWANFNGIRKRWFWISCVIAIAIHAAVVGTFWDSLPFSSLGIVVFFVLPESIVLQLVFIAVSRS